MIDRRLVGHEDETRLGPARANPRECLEQDRLIRRPGGAGHERRGAASEPEQRLVGRHRGHTRGHAVEARIAEDTDPVQRHSQAREPLRVRLRDGARRRDGCVAGVEQCAGRPAEPAAAGTHGGRHERYRDTGGSGPGGELGPEIELREHEEVGGERGKEPVGRFGKIVGQVVGRVHGEAAGERLGRRAEVGVDELAPWHEAPELEQHALGLQPLTYAGCVEPHERPRSVAPAGAPRRQPRGGATPPAVAVAHLLVHQPEGGGQRRADPDGGAIPPGGRRHRGNVAAARAGVNPAVRPGAPRGACDRTGARSTILSRSHVPPATEGGDPLSTESRVACGC